MTASPTPGPEKTEVSADADDRGSRAPILVSAAAAVVLVAVIAAVGLLRDNGDPTPTASGGSTTVTLSATTADGRCMAPTAEALARATVAVAGTVTGVDDGEAEIAVEKVYAGSPDLSRLVVEAPGADAQALIAAVDLKEGDSYLLAGSEDGRLLVCGFSGADSTQLRALYSQAFGQ